MPEIKICGLTTVEEAKMFLEVKVSYAGFVVFYPKSHRNNKIEALKEMIEILGEKRKKVAVLVSPTIEQISLLENMGFDYLQIHGELKEDVKKQAKLPIWRAINVEEGKSILLEDCPKIEGYVLDSKNSGSGRTFDWERAKNLDKNGKKLILAGGLSKENIKEAVLCLNPDIIDVSSSVENENGRGKNLKKIKEFIEAVQSCSCQ